MAQQTIMIITTNVGDIQHITDKFSKLEVTGLEIRQDGKTNTLKFQGINQMAESMTGIQAGSTLQITFDIEGREWVKDGKVNIFMNLNVVSFKVVSQAKMNHVPASVKAKDIDVSDVFDPNGDDDLPF